MKKIKKIITLVLAFMLILSNSATALFAHDHSGDHNQTPIVPWVDSLVGTATGTTTGNFVWDFHAGTSSYYTVETTNITLNGAPVAVGLDTETLSLDSLSPSTKYELMINFTYSNLEEKSFKIIRDEFNETKVETVSIFKKGNKYYTEKFGSSFHSANEAVSSLYPGYDFSLSRPNSNNAGNGYDRLTYSNVEFEKSVTKYALEGTAKNGNWYATVDEACASGLGDFDGKYSVSNWNHDRATVKYTDKVFHNGTPVSADFTTDAEVIQDPQDPQDPPQDPVDPQDPPQDPVDPQDPPQDPVDPQDPPQDQQPPAEETLLPVIQAFSAPTINYTLTVNVVNGTVPGFEGTHVFSSGTNVNLGAEAENDLYEFVGWSGDITSSDLNAVVVMTGDKTVTATFKLIEESVPEAPVAPVEEVQPEQETAVDNGADSDTILDTELIAQEAPVTELPKTSGIPVEAFAFIGTAMVSIGAVANRKNRK